MMKKLFARLFLYLALLTICGVAVTPCASGQTVSVEPTAIYRFRVSYWDGGTLLTGFFNEGTANGYSFDQEIFAPGDGALGMYVPPPGYLPDPAAGLVPLHRWTVIQNGWRTHYYYSTYYASHGSDYYYNGIAGWVYPPGTTVSPRFGLPLHQLTIFYSQDLGFWYGGSDYPNSNFVEPPPAHSSEQRDYFYQGLIAALPPKILDPQFPPTPNPFQFPTIWAVQFHAPDAPPGDGGGGSGGNSNSCNPSSGTVNACQHNGGLWDYDTCTCEY
jgi:hypothetical protein